MPATQTTRSSVHGGLAAQQPHWPDPLVVLEVVTHLTKAPGLVPAEESDLLRGRLAAVARGEAFLLQGGDCAETFQPGHADQLPAKLRTFFQMAALLGHGASIPVVKVGRIAGQYAKPRSQPTETRGGVTLPAYRGDAVNDREFTAHARTPDPRRMLRMYEESASTLAVVRHFLAAGASAEAEFFTSHEALLLDYENALIRASGPARRAYGLSGHLLWIGERTRQLDGAHVAFAARVANPVGVKLGPAVTSDEILALLDRIDPRREPGRVTLISRMGTELVKDRLPELVAKVTASGFPVVWACDPMHGNTFKAPDGRKTRQYETMLDEVRNFIEVHRALGTHPGGLHVEFTGDDVTECVGGPAGPVLQDLARRYETACDPRLNRQQALWFAAEVAEMLRGATRKPRSASQCADARESTQ